VVWPKSIAPFDVHIVQIQPQDGVQSQVAQSLHDLLAQEGFTCLWDDRPERPGVKFKDAELIGCPVRVTVGKRAGERVVEVEARAGGPRVEVTLERVVATVSRVWEEAL